MNLTRYPITPVSDQTKKQVPELFQSIKPRPMYSETQMQGQQCLILREEAMFILGFPIQRQRFWRNESQPLKAVLAQSQPPVGKQRFTMQLQHWSIRVATSWHPMHCMAEHTIYLNTHCLDLGSQLLLLIQTTLKVSRKRSSLRPDSFLVKQLPILKPRSLTYPRFQRLPTIMKFHSSLTQPPPHHI